mmetsp:Transcript_15528/g.27579  ORF Transcript_15528/g.27579 Transcript_15528/m.27579 type:complete len:217 (+) Transcript_15528:158-808(+)
MGAIVRTHIHQGRSTRGRTCSAPSSARTSSSLASATTRPAILPTRRVSCAGHSKLARPGRQRRRAFRHKAPKKQRQPHLRCRTMVRCKQVPVVQLARTLLPFSPATYASLGRGCTMARCKSRETPPVQRTWLCSRYQHTLPACGSSQPHLWATGRHGAPNRQTGTREKSLWLTVPELLLPQIPQKSQRTRRLQSSVGEAVSCRRSSCSTWPRPRST